MDRPPLDRVRGRGLAYAFLIAALLLAALPIHRTVWYGNAELHTLLETIGTLVALVTGGMALARFYAKKKRDVSASG
jgi:hypothetical protein